MSEKKTKKEALLEKTFELINKLIAKNWSCEIVVGLDDDPTVTIRFGDPLMCADDSANIAERRLDEDAKDRGWLQKEQ